MVPKNQSKLKGIEIYEYFLIHIIKSFNTGKWIKFFQASHKMRFKRDFEGFLLVFLYFDLSFNFL